MNAILKKENVYVVVRNKDIQAEDDLNNIEGLIWQDEYGQDDIDLYGGRVLLESYLNNYSWRCDMCRIKIDGIQLSLVNDSLELISEFSFEQVAAYLNQIENLGVDTFLENYKLQLQELKKEFESVAEKIQQELLLNNEEQKASKLDALRAILLSITCIVFSLLINMNAGLDNYCYTSAYDTIINQYF